MPENNDIRAALDELLVSVVDADPGAITPESSLKDLGVDSLSIIEVCEALGRRFGVEISDERVDSLHTVDDVVTAVAGGPDEVDSTPLFDDEELSREEIQQRKRRALVLIGWFVVIGIGIGLLGGFGGAAVLRAVGLKDLEPVPVSTTADAVQPSVSTSASASPSPTPATSPSATATDEPDEEASLVANPRRVAPGQRITLSGELAEGEPGARLQVQRKENGSWADFPVQGTLDSSQEFDMQISTSRTGRQEFRILIAGTDIATPSVTVTIGS